MCTLRHVAMCLSRVTQIWHRQNVWFGVHMPKMKLTKRNIDTISNPLKQEEYRDTDINGFSLIVYSSGRKQFNLRYRLDGKRRALKIGDLGTLTVDQARKKALVLLADILKGSDPQEAKKERLAVPTFEQWATDYLKEVEQRKKRPDSDRRFLSLAIQKYGHKKLNMVTRTDVLNHMKELKNYGKTNVTANRYHSSVRSCLNEAIRAGLITDNVSSNIRHFPEPNPRTRTLSDEEMQRLLDCISKWDNIYIRTIVYMFVETGARKTEVLSAKWEDILFDDALWRLPNTKANRPQIIPLSSNIIGHLKVLPRSSEWLFPSGTGDGCRKGFKKSWDNIRRKSGIEDVTLHDVRRTFGLQIARQAGLHIASKLLRHSSIRVTEQHYAPLGLDELRDALENKSMGIKRI